MSIKKKYNDFINIIDENIANLKDLNTNKVWSNTLNFENSFSNNQIVKESTNIHSPLISTVIEKINGIQSIDQIIAAQDTAKTNKKCICDTSSSDDFNNNIENIIKNDTTIFTDKNSQKSLSDSIKNYTLDNNTTGTSSRISKELERIPEISSQSPPKLDELRETQNSYQPERRQILDNSMSTQRVFDNSYDYITNQKVSNYIRPIDQSIAEESFQKSEEINEFDILINYNHKIEDDMNTINNQLDNLENLFNKTIMKKNNENNQNNQNNQNNNINYKKNNLFKGDILKHICSDIEEKIFLESTRGFNLRENIFKLRIDKLKENLKNYNPSSTITVGYIYRDFNNIKSYMNSDINTYWLNVYKTSDIITEKYLDPNSKLLQSCLKNLANNNKFKKKINNEIIRAFKKTIEINNIVPVSTQSTHLIENQNMQRNYSSIIIDIIFYTKNIINNTNI